MATTTLGYESRHTGEEIDAAVDAVLGDGATTPSLSSQVDGNATDIAALGTRLSAAEGTVGNHTTSIGLLGSKVGQAEAAINTLAGRASAVEDDISALQTSSDSLVGQIETLFGKANSGYRIAGFIAPGNSFDARCVENTAYLCLNNTGRSWYVPSGQTQGAQGVVYLPPSGYTPTGHAPSSVVGWTPAYLTDANYSSRAVLFGYRNGTWNVHPMASATKEYVDSLFGSLADLSERIDVLTELLNQQGIELEDVEMVWNPDDN